MIAEALSLAEKELRRRELKGLPATSDLEKEVIRAYSVALRWLTDNGHGPSSQQCRTAAD